MHLHSSSHDPNLHNLAKITQIWKPRQEIRTNFKSTQNHINTHNIAMCLNSLIISLLSFQLRQPRLLLLPHNLKNLQHKKHQNCQNNRISQKKWQWKKKKKTCLAWGELLISLSALAPLSSSSGSKLPIDEIDWAQTEAIECIIDLNMNAGSWHWFWEKFGRKGLRGVAPSKLILLNPVFRA